MPPPRAATRRPRRWRGPAAVLAAACACAWACAAPKQSWRDATQPEVFVDVLPRRAELFVDGQSLGPGPHTIPVPDPEHRYRLRATAAGFLPAEREEPGSRLAGARVGVVLRPQVFGAARPLDFDDGDSLAAASLALQRAGDGAAGLEYAERAVEATPGSARAQRALGDAAMAAGDRQRAIQAYSAYLRLAPGPEDGREIAARVEQLRGDVTIPVKKP
jgi:tetratricopeptide (TPR) repeat protein